MLSLHVHFVECESANHAMFYVSDSRSKTINRIHAFTTPSGRYFVHESTEKFDYPRNALGEGFQIHFAPLKRNATGHELTEILSEMLPPTRNEGGCQWWVLKNLVMLEKCGFAKPGSTLALLADKRMNSPRLMEFAELRNELQSDYWNQNQIDVSDFGNLSVSLSRAVANDGICAEAVRFEADNLVDRKCSENALSN